MSLNKESVNEAGSSQIPELSTSERKEISWKSNNYCVNDQFYKKRIPIQAQLKHNETKLTRSTPNKAQTMPIQAQNMPNEAQNTIRETTNNSPKIHM